MGVGKTNRASPKSALGKTLYYLKEPSSYLGRVLEDGYLKLGNNLTGWSMKPFVIRRKNFLFANMPRGAQSSAVIYGMIETAKANDLDPYRYQT
ncbi:hypothetical protein MM59RIKEN_18220 [Pusillibacter faecalis]|jgi:transposase|uniref:Transposase IS66 central domain-containing protein n=1 Tax=Pusillibacter faecalis TaxID=2714358 RepID=A0A810QJ95_9FIRM|nr:hypothetical protein MM59RIKEN_18220 [Pusillibacter faecalis]